MKTQPLLIRDAEIPDLAQGAAAFAESHPGDIFYYGHFGSYEDQVQELRDMGWTILRYTTVFAAHWEAAGWSPLCLERFLWDLFDSNDWWLRDKHGNHVRFRWYGEGPLYDLGWLQKKDAQAIADFIHAAHPSGPWLVDLVFCFLHQWMFLDRDLRIRDLAPGYSHLNYLRGMRLLHQAMGWPGAGTNLISNGDWKLDGNKSWTVMYENADTGSRYRYLWETVKRWQKHPGSILTISGHPDAAHVRRLVEDEWATKGGRLWCKDQATADYAWSVKSRLTRSREQ